jgi:ribosomal protein L39E
MKNEASPPSLQSPLISITRKKQPQSSSLYTTSLSSSPKEKKKKKKTTTTTKKKRSIPSFYGVYTKGRVQHTSQLSMLESL